MNKNEGENIKKRKINVGTLTELQLSPERKFYYILLIWSSCYQSPVRVSCTQSSPAFLFSCPSTNLSSILFLMSVLISYALSIAHLCCIFILSSVLLQPVILPVLLTYACFPVRLCYNNLRSCADLVFPAILAAYARLPVIPCCLQCFRLVLIMPVFPSVLVIRLRPPSRRC